MANTLINPSIIANEALMTLENDLVLGNMVHNDYSKEFAKVGDTVSIRRPVMFEGQSNNLDITSFRNDVTEGKIAISLDQTETVAWEFDSKELTLSVEEYSDRYIKPAVIKLKNTVESRIAALYKDVYWFTGTPGTRLGSFKSLGGAGTILTNAGVPMEGRYAVHTPDTALELADSLKNVYVQGKAKTAFEEASIGRYARFDNYESVHLIRHTVGALGGTPLVNGGSQNVTYASVANTYSQTLNIDGASNSITGWAKAGDVFTIANVYAVNPITKQSTGALQTFTVLADANSNGTGQVVLTISPAIVTTGPYQTVSAAPADNAPITIKTGTAAAQYEQSLAFHKNAFALVTRPLAIPDGATWAESRTGNKMSISVIKDFDFNKRKEMIRLDILFGVKTIYPQLAARITS